MRDKYISSASVKSNSRIPKPVSADGGKVRKQDYPNTRNLRSRSRCTQSSRPIRINRDCLKVIPVANDREVVERTRPLMRKGKSTESSSTTSQTSAPKPRAPVPSAIKSRTPIHSAMRSRVPVARITSHSCVKPAISTTTTQISTRVLRSHVFSKTSSSVCSSKTESCSAAKISTVNNLNTAKSGHILRSHVSSTGDAGTTSTRSNIPRFSWNLRSRSSVSKTESQKKKDDEGIRSLRKRTILKEAENTKLGKRLALSEKPHRPDNRNAEQKSNNDVEVNVLRPEKQERKVESKLIKTDKAVDLKLTKSIPVNAEISAVSQNKLLSSAGCEGINDISSHEKSLATFEHDVRGEPSLVEEPSLKTSLQVPGSITQDLPAKPFEERPLTPADSDIKILDKDIDASQRTLSPSAQVHEVVQSTLVAKRLVLESHLEGHAATLEVEIPVKFTRENASPLEENIASVKASAGDNKINGFVEPSIPAKVQLVSDEKPALSESPNVPKRKCGETSSPDDISTVKNRIDLEFAVKRVEVISDEPSDGPSSGKSPEVSCSPEETQTTSTVSFKTAKLEALKPDKLFESPHAEPSSVPKLRDEGFWDDTSVVKPAALQNVIEATKTSVVNASKPSTLTVAVTDDRFPVIRHTEISAVQDKISTVSKEHFDPVGISACYEPTNIIHERSVITKEALTTVVQRQQGKPFVIKPRASPVETEEKSWFKSSKRRASLTPIDNHCIVKKRRNINSENGKDESACFSSPFQSCSLQTMEIGSPIPVASNICMDVDPSFSNPRTVSNFIFEYIPATLNTQSGMNDDMELSESSQTLPFTFGNIQQQGRPTIGGISFATTDRQVGQSFGVAKPQNYSVFHNKPVVDGSSRIGNQASAFNNVTFGSVRDFSGFPSGVFSQATKGFQQKSFGRVPQQLTALPTSGLNQTVNHIFGEQPQQDNQQMSGLNQTHSFQIFGNPLPVLKVRPTLVNSGGSPRKFISKKGHRRRSAAKVRFHPNQTTNQGIPLVFANGFQTGLDFSMVAQSPTPMESEDVSFCSGNGSQQFNVQDKQIFGQNICSNHQLVGGSLQAISGQAVNDHSMEESVQSPSLMVCVGTLPQPRSTVSCFEISQQTRANVERKLSLPEMVRTSPAVLPRAPFPLQPARLKLPSASASCVNPMRNTRETSTNFSRAKTLCERKFKVDEQPSTLVGANQANDKKILRIYSSISSLDSSNSSLGDCHSDIDSSIDNLTESVSNCSLEDSITMSDIGKLIEMFKTLSIEDTPLNTAANS